MRRDINPDLVPSEIATMIRFVVVGLVNTAFGYGVILILLSWGFGDYPANALGFAIGLPVAYGLHRRFTFRPKAAIRAAEVGRFVIVFVLAYGANLGIVAAGRALGHVESPVVQLLAIGTYVALSYVLNRLIVFRDA